jgi:hypothetical protein
MERSNATMLDQPLLIPNQIERSSSLDILRGFTGNAGISR